MEPINRKAQTNNQSSWHLFQSYIISYLTLIFIYSNSNLKTQTNTIQKTYGFGTNLLGTQFSKDY